MKLSTEVKAGIIGLVTIAVLAWGINYLKGRNVLRSSYALVTFYPETGGLENSAPVLLNGVKIGYVDRILLRTGEDPPIEVVLSIDKQYRIPEGSRAELFSADLIGTKAIRILLSGKKEMHEHADTLLPAMAPDLLSSLQARLFPILDRVGMLAESLDSLAQRLNTLIREDALGVTLEQLAAVTGSLRRSLAPGGTLDSSFRNLESFSAMLADQQDEMASVIGNLNAVIADLDSAGLGELAVELKGVALRVSTLLDQVQSGKGSAGKFFYSDSLYDNLNVLVSDLDRLVRDLNENPENYVQISVFGKSRKKN
jgi:phospholipid/cholesterol/gamma-HCH transport system substrate-binding protein